MQYPLPLFLLAVACVKHSVSNKVLDFFLGRYVALITFFVVVVPIVKCTMYDIYKLVL